MCPTKSPWVTRKLPFTCRRNDTLQASGFAVSERKHHMPYPMPHLCSSEMWGPHIWFSNSECLVGTSWLVTHHLDLRILQPGEHISLCQIMIYRTRAREVQAGVPGMQKTEGLGRNNTGNSLIWTFILHVVVPQHGMSPLCPICLVNCHSFFMMSRVFQRTISI